MAEYGKMGSKEELRKSGYDLPDSHFITPAPDGSGEMSAEERKQLDEMKENEVSPPVDNKAVIPQKPARKRAK